MCPSRRRSRCAKARRGRGANLQSNPYLRRLRRRLGNDFIIAITTPGETWIDYVLVRDPSQDRYGHLATGGRDVYIDFSTNPKKASRFERVASNHPGAFFIRQRSSGRYFIFRDPEESTMLQSRIRARPRPRPSLPCITIEERKYLLGHVPQEEITQHKCLRCRGFFFVDRAEAKGAEACPWASQSSESPSEEEDDANDDASRASDY